MRTPNNWHRVSVEPTEEHPEVRIETLDLVKEGC